MTIKTEATKLTVKKEALWVTKQPVSAKAGSDAQFIQDRDYRKKSTMMSRLQNAKVVIIRHGQS